METKTGTNDLSTNIGLDGKHIYPCYCGAIHEGEYAAEDFAHHNCLHEAEWMAWTVGKELQIICPLCGFAVPAKMQKD